jgi:hypothetical protein
MVCRVRRARACSVLVVSRLLVLMNHSFISQNLLPIRFIHSFDHHVV